MTLCIDVPITDLDTVEEFEFSCWNVALIGFSIHDDIPLHVMFVHLRIILKQSSIRARSWI